MHKIKEIYILDDAINDLKLGEDFYGSIDLNLGKYFWNSLLTDIESLTFYAGIHSKQYGFFRMFSRKFPYAVYYEIRDEYVFVVAILPMKRNPEWIKSRILKKD